MLKCYLGREKYADKLIDQQSRLFMNRMRPEWFDNTLVKEIVKGVDNSDVIGPYLIQSPVLGPMSPDMLSGGAKCLIQMLFLTNYFYRSGHMGDNCAKFLQKVSDVVDVNLVLTHHFVFTDDQQMYFPQYDLSVQGSSGSLSVIKEHADDYYGPICADL